MFGATASLATTSAEDLRFFRVARVRPLPSVAAIKYLPIIVLIAIIAIYAFNRDI